MKADRLFLCLNDAASSHLKSELDFNKLLDDDYVMSEGQELLVLVSVSGRSSEDLHSHYSLIGELPLLRSHHGKEYSGYLEIEDYLISNGMLKD